MKRIISLILTFAITILSAFSISGCSNANLNEENDTGKLRIVATIFPYYEFARNIAGDKADVKMLLSPGNEPHSYDPSPSDIVAIENCDIFIYNGGESDEWVEGVLDSLQNSNLRILKMMDYVDALNEQETDHTSGDELDEHIWTSIRNAQKLSKIISETLKQIDAENSDYYSDNELIYTEMLSNLDNQIMSIVKNASKNTVVFGDRFPFLYFVNDYGLSYECAFPGCSSETEPSISTVTRLIDFVREDKIPVVFYLEFSNGKTADLIAEDTGAETLEFCSCHNVTKEQFESGVSYISLMQQNAKNLEEALS
ncbi:MAG: zinc ABC transporter substrate-binding protein [Ruminococcus sp.]|nr:zinc ABC transporter substrate-binding protein [Ruminococcus sp.]